MPYLHIHSKHNPKSRNSRKWDQRIQYLWTLVQHFVPISHFHSQSPLYFLSLHAFTTTKINLNSINFSTIKKKLNIFIFSFLWFCSFHSKHTQKETNPPPCISPSFNLHTHTHPDKLLLINCQFSIASQTCQVVLGQQAVTLASQKNKN